MKKGIILLCFWMISAELPAQILGDNPELGNIGLNFTNKMRKADLYVEYFAYADAVELYQQIAAKEGVTDTLRLKIAECYRKLNLPDSTANWYDRIESEQVLQPIDHLYHAQALHSMGDIAKAKIKYQKYYDLVSVDSRAPLKIEGIENITDHRLLHRFSFIQCKRDSDKFSTSRLWTKLFSGWYRFRLRTSKTFIDQTEV